MKTKEEILRLSIQTSAEEIDYPYLDKLNEQLYGMLFQS